MYHRSTIERADSYIEAYGLTQPMICIIDPTFEFLSIVEVYSVPDNFPPYLNPHYTERNQNRKYIQIPNIKLYED